ncbi:YlcI/YnfO family protein [Desulforudis sp. 1088]|uniref:YlcI/YnfO family protein n=1 Tax=unclassified Candidatus Desulforudis TaxID=2635950 RepID=UPI0034794BA6
MEQETRMIHIRMPVALIKQMDAYLKKNNKTKTDFIVHAVAERLRREAALESFRALRGSLAAEDAPEWAAAPGSEWVRELRGKEREVPVWGTL